MNEAGAAFRISILDQITGMGSLTVAACVLGIGVGLVRHQSLMRRWWSLSPIYGGPECPHVTSLSPDRQRPHVGQYKRHPSGDAAQGTSPYKRLPVKNIC